MGTVKGLVSTMHSLSFVAVKNKIVPQIQQLFLKQRVLQFETVSSIADIQSEKRKQYFVLFCGI